MERRVGLQEHSFDLRQGLGRELGELHADLLHDHVVLGQGACLVREEDLHPAQFFGDGGVTGDSLEDFLVLIDGVGVPNLG